MPNDFNYPGLDQIKDRFLSQALRLIWDKVFSIEQLIKDPYSGTLSPDEKPVFPEEGTKFFSTDFNRLYRFVDGAWEDDVTAPSRHQIAFFFAPPEPEVGWALCDGSSVNISTSSGGVSYFETPVIPVLNGQVAFIRL